MPDQNESLIPDGHDQNVVPEQVERELLLPAPPAVVWSIVIRPGWLAPEVDLDLVPGGDASFSSEEWSKSGWVEEAVAPGRADGAAGRLAFLERRRAQLTQHRLYQKMLPSASAIHARAGMLSASVRKRSSLSRSSCSARLRIPRIAPC